MIEKYVKVSEASQHTHYKGEWAVGLALEVGDIVWNDGVAFEVQAAHTTVSGDEPILDVVQGSQGETGATGADGAEGQQGPKGDAATGATLWSFNETPSGTMNGTNQVFTLAHTPAGQIMLAWQGMILAEGAGNDYTVSSTTITLLGDNKPKSGDNLLAFYPY